jgi:MtN3 and saliva related transmembrane protein
MEREYSIREEMSRMEILFSAIQLLGGVILSSGYVPQIVKVIRTKSAKDLSLTMFIMVLAGCLCYEAYCLYLLSLGTGHAFLITNTFSVIVSSIMVILILKYGKAK